MEMVAAGAKESIVGRKSSKQSFLCSRCTMPLPHHAVPPLTIINTQFCSTSTQYSRTFSFSPRDEKELKEEKQKQASAMSCQTKWDGVQNAKNK